MTTRDDSKTVTPAYAEKARNLNILLITIRYPLERLQRSSADALAIESVDMFLPTEVAETHCNSTLADADDTLATIEDAIKRYREGRPQKFQEQK